MLGPVRMMIKLQALVLVCVLCTVSCEHGISGEDSAAEEVHTKHSLYDELGLLPYEPPIELSMAGESSIFIEELMQVFPDESLADNRWTRLYEEVLGIKIVYNWIERGDMYDKKLGVAISSGDIPDVVRVDANQLCVY